VFPNWPVYVWSIVMLIFVSTALTVHWIWWISVAGWLLVGIAGERIYYR